VPVLLWATECLQHRQGRVLPLLLLPLRLARLALPLLLLTGMLPSPHTP
jgi:hypothetical protein